MIIFLSLNTLLIIFEKNPYLLFNKLNLSLNDKIKLIVPKSSNTVFGNIPRAKSFYIGGYFDSGMFTYDNNLAFIDLDIGKKLFLNDTNKIFFVSTR